MQTGTVSVAAHLSGYISSPAFVGNPIGGLVFSSAFGQLAQVHEWTNFMSDSEFCFRACKDGPRAPALCQHIYDVMGCAWNMPANYNPGVFEGCKGDTGEVRVSTTSPPDCALIHVLMTLQKYPANGSLWNIDLLPGPARHARCTPCAPVFLMCVSD